MKQQHYRQSNNNKEKSFSLVFSKTKWAVTPALKQLERSSYFFSFQSESLEAHTTSVLCTLEIHAEITDGDNLEMLMKDAH